MDDDRPDDPALDLAALSPEDVAKVVSEWLGLKPRDAGAAPTRDADAEPADQS